MSLPWEDFSAIATDTATPKADPNAQSKPWEDFAGAPPLTDQFRFVGQSPYEEQQAKPFEAAKVPAPPRPINLDAATAAEMKYRGRDLPSVVEPWQASAMNAVADSVGKVLPVAGSILAAEGQDAAERAANWLTGYKSTESKWRNTMSLPSPFTEDIPDEAKPTPYEEELQQTSGATKLAGELATGITKTLPQLVVGGEIAGGAKALGFSEKAAQAVGMGTAFGFDRKGFDPKQAAIMAAFPGVAELGGEVAAGTLARVGIKPTSAVAKNAIKWFGSLAGSQAYMEATQLPDYANPDLTPQQKRDIFINNLAQNIAFHLYSLPGMALAGCPGKRDEGRGGCGVEGSRG